MAETNDRGGGTLRVTADTTGVSLAELRDGLLEMGRGLEGRPLILGPGLFTDLVRLTGDGAAAMRVVVDLAGALDRPVAVNLPDPARGRGATATAVVGPPTWPQAKVDGWAAGIHEALAAQFGPIAGPPRPPNRRARRRRDRGG